MMITASIFLDVPLENIETLVSMGTETFKENRNVAIILSSQW